MVLWMARARIIRVDKITLMLVVVVVVVVVAAAGALEQAP